MPVIHYAEVPYGFEYGSATVTRLFSDADRGWVIVGIEAPRQAKFGRLQVYVTKTGKIRVHDSRGEWTSPQDKEAPNA